MVAGEDIGEEGQSLDQLPTALLASIMSLLDLASLCSVASTSRTLKSCASHVLTFLPDFHVLEFSPTIEVLGRLLPQNPYLRSLKVDCGRLGDSSIDILVRSSLDELCLYNCKDFNGRLLSVIGGTCSNLRRLYLDSVAEKVGRAISVSDLEELLRGCSRLEALTLMFDLSLFLRHNLAQIWSLAPKTLKFLEIGYISSLMVTELLAPNVAMEVWMRQDHLQPSILPGIQKLCLAVDNITDVMVGAISRGLMSLTHLDLRDTPIGDPIASMDLTNAGFQQINQQGKLKHLSLVRSQEFTVTYFRRVNDLGMLLMADRCARMESICLRGFCKVTDTGIKTILHSCSTLYSLKVSSGGRLTDLVFHDISATSLSLIHVSLRWCSLLTDNAIKMLVLNTRLECLDLKDCRSLGDEALRAIGSLPSLKTLLFDGTDVSDSGICLLRKGGRSSLISLSLRGCRRLTDKCITALFEDGLNMQLRELDLSNLPFLSDKGIVSLVQSGVPISKLWIRQCPLIGDTSVMALASVQPLDQSQGSSIQLLDVYNCGGITQLACRWLKKPYFPRLRWLGLNSSLHRDPLDDLARSRPLLLLAYNGQELDSGEWRSFDSLYMNDFDEVDELEQWIHQFQDEEDMLENYPN